MAYKGFGFSLKEKQPIQLIKDSGLLGVWVRDDSGIEQEYCFPIHF